MGAASLDGSESVIDWFVGNLYKYIINILLVFLLTLSTITAQPGNGNGNGNNDCQEPPCGKGPGNGGPPGNPTVPIDSYLVIMVMAGIMYGGYALRHKKPTNLPH